MNEKYSEIVDTFLFAKKYPEIAKKTGTAG
jgi:hypothetical protein